MTILGRDEVAEPVSAQKAGPDNHVYLVAAEAGPGRRLVHAGGERQAKP